MLSKDDVTHIANLAKIELTEEEVLRFQQELSQVLEYFTMLEQVDTANISPMLHSSLATNVTRKDALRDPDHNRRADLLAAFAASENEQCKIKAVFEQHHADA